MNQWIPKNREARERIGNERANVKDVLVYIVSDCIHFMRAMCTTHYTVHTVTPFARENVNYNNYMHTEIRRTCVWSTFGNMPPLWIMECL